ncbi:RNA methyltransferase [Aestuariibacter sp. AA17]|uniref:RNA methyltransferase n=1 Tax=Fluctibacter corallii TaxID=2984329 RepID=A0ABT3A5Q5_9ALTE|nr:RNA methyltransferase [Aestuariibacter sp. AA17]MCV2883922.1 RNA methyltransferase [Aestuariibacter sp. AA17]
MLNQVTLGVINPKSASNMGSILRACGCYGVSSVFYTGQRYGYAKQFATDTKNASQSIPTIGCADLKEMRPKGARVVAVELIEGATPLPHFEHPDNAFYLFGPEDGSISQQVLDWCDDVVYVPTKGCMNLAATVNVLLYDRLAKRPDTVYSDEHIVANRDTNNRAKHTKNNN